MSEVGRVGTKVQRCLSGIDFAYFLPHLIRGVIEMKAPRLAVYILIPLLVAGCDFDRFIGYDYDGESLIETTSISGKVVNAFTGVPVWNATVTFGEVTTHTDSHGDYLLIYPFGTDEERNRPVMVTVSKANHFPIATGVLIHPEPSVHNFSLEYAAPIIEYSRLQFDSPFQVTCYATIFDYQGVDDIEKFEAIFLFEKEKEKIFVPVPMEEDSRLSENRAQFKCTIQVLDTPYGSFNSRVWQVAVTDKSGFSATMEFIRPF